LLRLLVLPLLVLASLHAAHRRAHHRAGAGIAGDAADDSAARRTFQPFAAAEGPVFCGAGVYRCMWSPFELGRG